MNKIGLSVIGQSEGIAVADKKKLTGIPLIDKGCHPLDAAGLFRALSWPS